MCNARLADSQVNRWCRPDTAGRNILEIAMKRLGFSARARVRVLKLARTIADLDGDDIVAGSHVSQAIMLRCLDRGGADDTNAGGPVSPAPAREAYFAKPTM